MKDKDQTKEELINELKELQQKKISLKDFIRKRPHRPQAVRKRIDR